MAYVYIFFFKDIPIYVGKGTYKNRWKEHFKAVNDKEYGYLFHRKLRKIYEKGEEDLVRVEIKHNGVSNNTAIELEKYYIQLYGRINLGKGSLYNLTDGGEGKNKIMSEEQKKLLSNLRKGVSWEDRFGKEKAEEMRKKQSKERTGLKQSSETCNKKRQALLGHKHTEESKKKMSDSSKGCQAWNKGKPMSQETKEKLSKAMKGKPGYWLGKEACNKGKHRSKDSYIAWYTHTFGSPPSKERLIKKGYDVEEE